MSMIIGHSAEGGDSYYYVHNQESPMRHKICFDGTESTFIFAVKPSIIAVELTPLDFKNGKA